MANTWVPARTLASPKAIILGVTVGVALGAALIYAAVGPGFNLDPNWKRAASWARDSRLSRWQKLALETYDVYGDDPVINLIGFDSSRINTDMKDTAIVPMRIRTKAANGGTESKLVVIRVGKGVTWMKVDPRATAFFDDAGDAVVISGRPH